MISLIKKAFEESTTGAGPTASGRELDNDSTPNTDLEPKGVLAVKEKVHSKALLGRQLKLVSGDDKRNLRTISEVARSFCRGAE